MNPQLANLLLVLGIVQVARKLDLDNPEVLIYVRLGYLVTQTIILAACYIAATKIKEKNDITPFKYVEPAKPFSNEQAKLVETNNRDYDLSKVQELIKQTGIGFVIMLALHFYWNFTQPLFIQSIIPLKNLYNNKIVQIHVFGKPAEGDLKRPFKEASPFGQLSDSQQPQTDKAAIKKAAKASKSGEKDD
ncbi:inorganic phosphate transporter Pho88 [Glomus cerebriforme]|uniref:Inorganic phosphate transporter Pho88 n=1 Tax=Glomus cerebriforme TaxID=658196 RepID=A0A397T4P1_9GLOM|nr:inorganic phosphate transporter Pho88 [Glomus cerebriforme]